MRLAHLVLAHREPALVGRLARRLAHPEDSVLIHVDGKVDPTPFRSACAGVDGAAFMDRPLRVRHSAFSLVEASLVGFRQLMSSPEAWEYVCLISGQHYPIKRREGFIDLLDELDGRSSLEWFPLPDQRWPGGGMDRIQQLAFRDTPRYLGRPVLEAVGRRLPPRSFPAGVAPYGGGQWVVLHRDHVQRILRFIDDRPDVMRFYRRTRIADEMFFHTALLNSVSADEVVDRQLTYVEWGRADKPAVLDDTDLPHLAAGPELFARKFTMERCDVLQRIDDELLGEAVTPAA